ncbi:tRNA (N6-isopentenyl adenosine(37)-C2)-methylthiotransferase MiaB [candidate division KSB1 bacterium]|nr:tRNA (N6-isopentenyl adenosine(37)-C2)-methylthiotransferase MiaB [candidate division KSB1 bacterium]
MSKVYIETYGCQMNEYDTEIVRAVLQQDRYDLTDSPAEADVILLNTCSVRENANRKVFGRVHTLRHENNGRNVKIGIIGCMATDFKQRLLDDPHVPVDFIVGPDSYKRLAGIIRDAFENEEKGFDVKLSKHETYEDIYPVRQSGVNAWIAVMRGCNNFCSFCVVPYTRGRERSRSPLSVMNEAKKLANENFSQVTLLGQNVNSYSYDGKDFAYLLNKVSEIDGIERIRFTSPHPKDFPDSLLNTVAENPHVCKHIHLPLQAGNTRVLDMMRRTYTHEEYLDLVDRIRAKCPEIVLTTDIIVGFPSEIDKEFEDTVKIMQAVEFDSAFIFKYSERDGTLAQKKYPNDVPEEKKTERIMRLNELQKEHSLKRNRAHIGRMFEVLIEQEQTKKSDTDIQGRNDGNKLVIIPNNGYHIGEFIQTEITDATAHVLKGKVINHK